MKFNIAIFSVGNLLNKGFFFVMTILAAKTLSSPLFGIFSLIKQSISTAVFISLIGLNYYILRDLNDTYKSGEGDTKKYLRGKLINLILSQITVVLVLILLFQFFDDGEFLSTKLKIIIPLTVAINAFVIIQNSILSSQERFKITGFINSFSSFLFLVIIIFASKNFNLDSFFYIYFAYNLLIYIIQDIGLGEFSISYNIFTAKFNLKEIKFFKNLGLVYFHEILSFLTITLFFFIIARLISLSELAKFNLYYQILLACFYLPESLGPYFITSFYKTNFLNKLFKNLRISLSLSFIGFILFLISIPLLELFLNYKYNLGLNYYYIIFLLLIPYNFTSQLKKLCISQKKDKQLFFGQVVYSISLILGTIIIALLKFNSLGLIICLIFAETSMLGFYYLVLKNDFKKQG